MEISRGFYLKLVKHGYKPYQNGMSLDFGKQRAYYIYRLEGHDFEYLCPKAKHDEFKELLYKGV
jgi:hypothetical protein